MRCDTAAGRTRFALRLASAILLLLPAGLDALQDPGARADTTERRVRFRLEPLVVTATRQLRQAFELAAPVAAIDSLTIRRLQPNTAADLLRDLPGLDVNGVGPNQARPIIRGQRGQRILLLEDGLRLNNSRRQQDFGELPALVDVNGLARVEVVRGPASVLYGSDAIGGVVNLITDETPPIENGDTFGGRVEYAYRGAGDQRQPSGEIFGRVGRIGFAASGTFREADAYSAPAGTFGQVELGDDVLVNDTGVRDRNISLRASYDMSPLQSIYARVSAYDAEDAGFGFVSNEDLGTVGDPTIEILYPDQNVARLTFGYEGAGLGLPFADRLDVRGYYSDNERELDLGIFIPFSPQTPESGVSIVTNNFTDIETRGARIEAARALGRVTLTYGADYSHDDSENTDRNETSLIGAGPPMPPEVVDGPLVPNATYTGVGVFAQGELEIHDRVSLIVGGRYQDVSAETRQTAGSAVPPTDFSEGTFVAAANLLVGLTDALHVAVNVGRGFRAPNLVELFFEGPTPEGSGFQVVNTGLESETSLNVDVGLKLATDRVSAEIFYFQNDIENGIRIEPTGNMVGPLAEFRNVNLDEIRYRGIELGGDVRPWGGLTLGGSFSWLDAEDTLDPTNPIGESYSTKLTSHARYVDPVGRFWGEYRLRHSGESRDGQVISGPVGETLPAFTVHDLRGGVRLFERGGVRTGVLVGLTNLTDALYAEASNASFFRPQPGRALQVGLTVAF